MELDRQKWAELQRVKEAKSFYELEERFDEVVGDMNSQLLESELGPVHMQITHPAWDGSLGIYASNFKHQASQS